MARSFYEDVVPRFAGSGQVGVRNQAVGSFAGQMGGRTRIEKINGRIAEWKVYSEKNLQQFAATRPSIKGNCRDLLEFATGVAIHRPSGRSRSGLAQQQATRRFLAQMKRVRGAAIKAR
jgi:hypothetical protein